MKTTPTGIPIEECGACNHRHPVTRKHCPACGLAHLFPCMEVAALLCDWERVAADDSLPPLHWRDMVRDLSAAMRGVV